jgi:hypothetical protein
VWELLFWFERTSSTNLKNYGLRNFSSKHIFPWKSQFTNDSRNFSVHEGVLLIPFNYKTWGQMQQGRETVIKLPCAAGMTIMNQTYWWLSVCKVQAVNSKYLKISDSHMLKN